MTGNPVAALLQQAAQDLKAAAMAATGGPWWHDESSLCWRLHGVHARIPAQLASDGTVLIGEQVMSHQIIKAPKAGTTGFAEYWPGPADAQWITRMHPGTGLLIAGLLEAQAREAGQRITLSDAGPGHEDCACGRREAWSCEACGYPVPGQGPPSPPLCACWDAALSLARAWLGPGPARRARRPGRLGYVTMSVRQRERERRAVDYACPNRMRKAPAGEPCAAIRSSGQVGSFRHAGPRAHPHEERTALVPGWTKGAAKAPAAPWSGFEPYVPSEESLLAERYLERALYVLRSNEDPIPLVSGALALLRMDVGEQPEDDLDELRETAGEWEDQ